MIDFCVGQIVKSKAGHDKDKLFIIKSIEGEYVYLIDGKNRSLDKPKKKKMKHIQITHFVVKQTFKNSAEVQKAIKLYRCQGHTTSAQSF